MLVLEVILKILGNLDGIELTLIKRATVAVVGIFLAV